MLLNYAGTKISVFLHRNIDFINNMRELLPQVSGTLVPVTISLAAFAPAGAVNGIVIFMSILKESLASVYSSLGQMFLPVPPLAVTFSNIAPQLFVPATAQSAVVFGFMLISGCGALVLFLHDPVSLTLTFHAKNDVESPIKSIGVAFETNSTLKFVFPSFSTSKPFGIEGVPTELKSLHPVRFPSVVSVQLVKPPDVLTLPVPKSTRLAENLIEEKVLTVKLTVAFGDVAKPVIGEKVVPANLLMVLIVK